MNTNFFILAICAAYVHAWVPGCGVSKYEDAGGLIGQPAITARQESRPNEFPWMVSLMLSSSMTHLCGAVLISSRYILTAAQCTYFLSARDFVVLVGDHNRSEYDGTETLHSIATLRQHPFFNMMTFANDISILTTSSDILLNENVVPACSPTEGELYAGRTVILSAWGTLNPGDPCCLDNLHYADMPVVSNEVCSTYFNPGFVTGNSICAGDTENLGFCQYDVGGPLVVKNEDGTWSLVGIASFKDRCDKGFPQIYVRVSQYLDFIGDPTL